MSKLFPGRRQRLLPALAAGFAVLTLTAPALAIDTGGDGGAPAAAAPVTAPAMRPAMKVAPVASAHAPTLAAARKLIARADWAAAIKMLRAVTAAEPHSADAFNLLGYSLRRDGQMDAAETAYDRALSIDPHHLGANEYLGELYALTGHLDKARAQLQTIKSLCGNITCEAYRDLAKAIGAKA
jgi:Flp pilus assembly protein TadD